MLLFSYESFNPIAMANNLVSACLDLTYLQTKSELNCLFPYIHKYPDGQGCRRSDKHSTSSAIQVYRKSAPSESRSKTVETKIRRCSKVLFTITIIRARKRCISF